MLFVQPGQQVVLPGSPWLLGDRRIDRIHSSLPALFATAARKQL
jgi:hypothetical protein